MANNLKELKFDDKNFNKHTQFGMSLIEKSLRENGAGRSILIDKDNNIIAGNGIAEAAGSIGLENVRIIETDGNEIIAVKRTDLSLDSKKGREMALADNATSAADLEWDEDILKGEFEDEELAEWGIDFSDPNFISADELMDVSPLPMAYKQKEDVEHILFDRAIEYDSYYDKLVEEKDNCQNEELKKILNRRLKDFADFDFEYLADYYQSGASDEDKRLMELFGLVIPTEKRALELELLDLEKSVILGGGTL